MHGEPKEPAGEPQGTRRKNRWGNQRAPEEKAGTLLFVIPFGTETHEGFEIRFVEGDVHVEGFWYDEFGECGVVFDECGTVFDVTLRLSGIEQEGIAKLFLSLAKESFDELLLFLSHLIL